MKKNVTNKMILDMERDELHLYSELLDEGTVFQKKNLSKYNSTCYKNMIHVNYRIHCHLDYGYYIDKVKNTCILFFNVCITHESKLPNCDNVLVIKYGSQEELTVSSLLEYYRNYCVEADEEYLWKGDLFTTESLKYNSIRIVSAVSQLLTLKDIEWKQNKMNIPAYITAQIIAHVSK